MFVATQKDFEILPYSIRFAIKSLGINSSFPVLVIVPDSDFDDCVLLLQDLQFSVRIIRETEYVSSELNVKLKQTFHSRSNWVLQQILKVEAAKTSHADAVLIVDSDTLLLTERPWIDSKGRQLLTPTYEFNSPYYDFLSSIGVGTRNPRFTFVPHHMIIQPSILNEILEQHQLDSVGSLVEWCCASSNKESESPICIDFELYAQSLLSKFPESKYLQVWGNVTVPSRFSKRILNSSFALRAFGFFFYSISFHSWS